MISVIIPVYNVEKYLRECLDSVLNQSFDDLEIICVNDGSTDNSLNILKEYHKKDARIKIITQENKGLSSARNTGLEQSTGNYIYFIDSDDYIENNALSEVYNLAESKDLDMVIFKLLPFYDDTKEKVIKPYQEMEFLKEIVGENVFNFRNLGMKMYNLAVTVQGVLFKRELISNLRFPEGLIFEDNVFFTEAVLNANRILFYDKHLCNYRLRKGSIIDSKKNFSDIIEITNKLIDLAKKYDNFYPALYSKKFHGIVFRFLQVADEDKEDFFMKIQKDFIMHKEEYESSQDFNKLSEKEKNIFYAGLNSKNYKEFENRVS